MRPPSQILSTCSLRLFCWAGAGMSLVAGLAVSIGTGAEDSASPRSVSDGVYSTAQVSRGQKHYEALCARCHGETLGGGEASPPLVDAPFLTKWYGKSVGELVEYTRLKMPTDGPGILNRKLCTDVTAFVLSANDYPAGPHELVPNLQSLNQIQITPLK